MRACGRRPQRAERRRALLAGGSEAAALRWADISDGAPPPALEHRPPSLSRALSPEEDEAAYYSGDDAEEACAHLHPPRFWNLAGILPAPWLTKLAG